MSPPPANDLKRLLLGSAIGAAIGLVLLALGVAILWNAADQRLTETAEPAPSTEAPETRATPPPAVEARAYPALPPAPPAVPAPLPVEPPQAARPSLWGSIFDTEDDKAAPPHVAPPAARSAPGSSSPRPSTPRRAPEPQRQEDSLFF